MVANNKKGLKESFAKVFENPNRINFKELLQDIHGEYDELDFKQEYIDDSKLAKHILGMANSGGGAIIFGVEEKEEGCLTPTGLDNFKDTTDIKKELSKFLPFELEYEIYNFEYEDDNEWKTVKNKKFQLMIIEYTPWNIPFLSKADGKNIKRKDIYCRKNSSTTKVDYEDLKKILDIRIDDGMNNNKNTFDEDIDQIETLYLYFERYKYLSNLYFTQYLKRLINKKRRIIEDKL
ncbi:MAG: ATP-binding protein [Methanobrevibacter woesei]|nr:ATP-binding protein [Methanobrevibacter woesei]